MTDSKVILAHDGRLLPPPEDYQAANGRLPDDDFELRDILGVLVRRKWIVIGFVALSMILTGLILYFEKPIYQARAVIRLENTQRALAGGLNADVQAQLTGRTAPDFLLSQLEILRSAQVLGEVVDREGLRLVILSNGYRASLLDDIRISSDVVTDTIVLAFESDGVVASSRRASEVRAPYGTPVELAGIGFSVASRYEGDEEVRLAVLHRQRAIEQLAGNLRAQPREGTDVVEIEYTSTDRELTASVVNTVVEAFRERNIEAARQQSQRRRLFLEVQLAQADSLLVEAQQTLSEFRSRERVYSSSEWLAAQQTGLMNLDVRREETNANRRMYRSILDGLRGAEPGEIGDRLQSLVASPEIAGNPVVSGLFTQLIVFESARDSLVGGAWGVARTNPDVTRLEEQIRGTTGRLETAVRSHLETLDARVVALDGLRAQTSANLAALPEVEIEQTRLVGAVYSGQRSVDQLREEYQLARIAEAVEAGQVDVVDLAVVPLSPEGAATTLKLALGLMLGLVLGGGGAFLRESLNTRIRQRDEMEQVLHVTSVGVIPRIPGHRMGLAVPVVAKVRGLIGRQGAGGKGGRGSSELVMITQRGTPHAEAFGAIRTNLLFSDAVKSLRTLVVTSPAPEEGKTTTAANLAVAYAQQGLRVLLVNCDLRRPRLHRLMGVPREPGLTELLLGQAAWDDVCHDVPVEGMHFLASGVLPPNPSELLGGTRMREALEMFRERYELVVLDTPPLIAGPDAAILGSRCDAVVLVVRAGSTEREAGQQAVRQLQAVGARIVGAVLNDPDGELPKYSSYYAYQYKYAADER